MNRLMLVALLTIALSGCTLWPSPQPPSVAPRLHPADVQVSPVDSIQPAAPTLGADVATAVGRTKPTETETMSRTTTYSGTSTNLITTAVTVNATDPVALATMITAATEAIAPAESTTVRQGDAAQELIIGYSVQGRSITATVFGSGPHRVALIGGIHGGYEWNTILFAYQLIDYLHMDPDAIPPALTVYVVASANPDGQALVAGTEGLFTPQQLAADTRPGRLNANGVDLNRNWDCHWNPLALWGDTQVSGGSAPFSEPEAQALATFLTQPPMAAVVFWHSAASGVFAGGCDGPYAPSEALARSYAAASGYPFQSQFTSYTVTGDATDWLSLQQIPAITVEFYNHEDLDWEGNLAGTLAILQELGSQDVGTVPN